MHTREGSVKRCIPTQPDPWRDRFLISAELELGRDLAGPRQPRRTMSMLNPTVSPAGWWIQLADAELAAAGPNAVVQARRAIGIAIAGFRRQAQPGRATKAARIHEQLERTPPAECRALLADLLKLIDLSWFMWT